ncbi:tRNA uridine(34) hydroxylase [Buchnera aphidicola (Thelaxes suberi)]|uniref:oxygen-dependent tRNA uridine(34) hydroxylase TrhO n=1 Tax=Buchnera aphidicola TaxID=9 RepID=UPI003463C0C9
MIILHNTISKKILKKKIQNDSVQRIIVSFYKYFFIEDTVWLKTKIYLFFLKLNILGRVYIAREGINAQISVPLKKYIMFKKFVRHLNPKLNLISFNTAIENSLVTPFWVLCVKIREKIVSDGINYPFFAFYKNNCYLQANSVNHMIDDNQSIILDIRNKYEFNVGRFDNAINIPSKTFSQQMKNLVFSLQEYKNKKILLYCTGGIRCEKAAAWLQFNNFKKIYQVQGGIIGYVHNAKKNNISLRFKGANFVFDNRMIERISDDVLGTCFHCQNLCDNYINCKNSRCNLLFIQCNYCQKKYNYFCSIKCSKKTM